MMLPHVLWDAGWQERRRHFAAAELLSQGGGRHGDRRHLEKDDRPCRRIRQALAASQVHQPLDRVGQFPQRNPFPLGGGDVGEVKEFGPTVPSRKVSQLVAAHDQDQRRLRSQPIAQDPQRVYSVTGAGSRGFELINLPLAVLSARQRQGSDRDLDHCQPVRSGRLHLGRAGLLPGIAGGHDDHLVDVEGFCRCLAERKVTDVDRIETAAENAYATPPFSMSCPGALLRGADDAPLGFVVPFHTHCRGTRKSLTRRASGVPGSACHW